MKISTLIAQEFSAKQQAFVIFSDINITYLTGFTGHAATLIVTQNKHYLLTDYRYVEQAKKQINDNIDVICRDRSKQSLGLCIQQVLNAEAINSLIYEAAHISVAQWQALTNELVLTNYIARIDAVELLRYQKNSDEIRFIKQAATIADQALVNTLPLIKLGMSERELATELEYQMSKLGSEELAFATILLFGERSALPHGLPSERQLKQGDLILFDFGAVVNGYRSDMTRTYVFGKASKQQQQVYQIVRQAQQAAIDVVYQGISGQQLQKVADNILLNSEYGQYKGEGLGHGVGLVLHELPFIDANCQLTIETGCVFTIEPGIYIPDWGGIRIEDDVVLGENGLEILTHAPKTLLEI
jgi:Xaa-Pro aminopeptidase